MPGKQRYELWAEAVRDIGILLATFAPLDTVLKPGYGTRIDWLIAVGIFVLGLLFITVGVRMASNGV
jgi:uncharacterized membrane protein (DUF485 family)